MTQEKSFRERMQEKYVKTLAKPIQNEFLGHMLPFWLSLSNSGVEEGSTLGTVGLLDNDLNVHVDAPRSLVFVSRMLWTYAEIVLSGVSKEALEAGWREYEVLQKQFRDLEGGGYFWFVYPDGTVEKDTKLVYGHSFAIYALAAWYRATEDRTVLSQVKELFAQIEGLMRLELGDVTVYGEHYSRDFQVIDNEILSTHGDNAQITMNTVLHMIEAYTGVYQAWPDPKVRNKLFDLLAFYAERIFDDENNRLHVFLDYDLHPTSDVWSLGHDIEAAWLVEFAVDILCQHETAYPGEETLMDEIRSISRRIEDAVLEVALEEVVLEDGSIALCHINEIANGEKDRTRIWWVQAEALCAVINAGVKREDESYFELAEKIWRYIDAYLIDRRPGAEWHAELDGENRSLGLPPVDPWKAFYHNGRMCVNLLRFFQLVEGYFG